ncbi:hypothetical protein QUF80_18435 [Desulfococcaceae bacterium HSG8]|nr:hypothetical protein [Desulfococcaceae bacterium HSG8]
MKNFVRLCAFAPTEFGSLKCGPSTGSGNASQAQGTPAKLRERQTAQGTPAYNIMGYSFLEIALLYYSTLEVRDPLYRGLTL